jgi:hypothetical protein
MATTIDYVSTETAKVTHPTSGEVVRHLLWGDRVGAQLPCDWKSLHKCIVTDKLLFCKMREK